MIKFKSPLFAGENVIAVVLLYRQMCLMLRFFGVLYGFNMVFKL